MPEPTIDEMIAWVDMFAKSASWVSAKSAHRMLLAIRAILVEHRDLKQETGASRAALPS
jgi:hypothetical protein